VRNSFRALGMTGRRVLRATRIIKNNHDEKAAGNALVVQPQLIKFRTLQNLAQVYADKGDWH
jgi:hypothetical protein